MSPQPGPEEVCISFYAEIISPFSGVCLRCMAAFKQSIWIKNLQESHIKIKEQKTHKLILPGKSLSALSNFLITCIIYWSILINIIYWSFLTLSFYFKKRKLQWNYTERHILGYLFQDCWLPNEMEEWNRRLRSRPTCNWIFISYVSGEMMFSSTNDASTVRYLQETN